MSKSTREFIDDLLSAWNSHEVGHAAEFYAPDYEGVDVSESTPHRGQAGVRQMLTTYFAAFPDLHFTNEATIVEGNRAVMIWIADGTHLGRVMNIPPSGHKIQVRGVTVLTLENNKVRRALYIWDVAGLLRNIGLLPELA
ncbi:MAG: ester cyclase [Chloroflexota bacterium]